MYILATGLARGSLGAKDPVESGEVTFEAGAAITFGGSGLRDEALSSNEDEPLDPRESFRSGVGDLVLSSSWSGLGDLVGEGDLD